MLREIPKGPDLQVHIDFEAEEAKIKKEETEKRKAIEEAGFIYDLVKDQVKKNPINGAWELRGVPLDNLSNLYEGNDNSEQYNRNNIH